MRAYNFIEVDFFGQPLYNGKNHGTCKSLSPPVQEQRIFMSFLDGNFVTVIVLVKVNMLLGIPANRHKTLLIALTCDAQHGLVRSDIALIQVERLGNTQA